MYPGPALFLSRDKDREKGKDKDKEKKKVGLNKLSKPLKPVASSTSLSLSRPFDGSGPLESSSTTQFSRIKDNNSHSQDTIQTPSPTSSVSSVATMVSLNPNKNFSSLQHNLHKGSVASEASTGSHNSHVSSSTENKSVKLKVLKTFGKRAATIAGDIAFGSTYSRQDEYTQKKANLYYKELQSKKLAEKVEQQAQLASANVMDRFLSELKFYLKFASESDPDDSINFANARKDIWNDTYRDLLTHLRIRIKELEDNIDDEEYMEKLLEKHSPEGLHADKQTLPHLVTEEYVTDRHSSTFAQKSAVAKQKAFDNLNDLVKPQEVLKQEGDVFQPKILHENQLILIISWISEITEKFLGNSSPLLPLTKAAIQRVQANIESDPSSKAEVPEVCNLIGSHNFEHELEYNNTNRLNFLAGWVLRNKEPEYYVNSVSLSSTMQSIYDKNKHGYLKDEELEKYPNFFNSVLEKMERKDANTFLSRNEMDFLSKYSFFSTPLPGSIPLSDCSQSAVYCNDFTALVPKDQFQSSLSEIYRILKPKGAFQLQVRDIALLNATDGYDEKSENMDLNELVSHKIWTEMGKRAEENGFHSQLTTAIIPLLYKTGFTKVSYSVVAYPQVSSMTEEAFTDSATSEPFTNSHIADSSPRQEKRKVSVAYSNKNSMSSLLSPSPSMRTDSVTSSMNSEINHLLQSSNPDRKPVGYNDSRVNDLFEFYSNFLEFKLFYKFTGINFRKMINEHHDNKKKLLEELEFAKVLIDYKFNGSNGELVKRKFLNSIPHPKSHARHSQLLSVPEGVLQSSPIDIESSPSASGSSSSHQTHNYHSTTISAHQQHPGANSSGIQGAYRNEGFSYVFVVVAEK